MKKIIFALAALSMVALMGLTSCKKEEPVAADPMDEFVEMGRYVGMDFDDVKNNLVQKGWTDASTSEQFLYSKTINGNTATLEIWSSGTGGNCYRVVAGLVDTNYYEDAKSIFNKMTASYTFRTVSLTASFTGLIGKKADSTLEIQPDYLGAQGCVVNNSYVAFNATWKGSSDYRVKLICTDDTQSFTIDFGQVAED